MVGRLMGLTLLVFGCGGRPPAARAADPLRIAAAPVPADNPTTDSKVELGRRLFYDADLSINGTMSCATCHGQRRAFAHGTRTHPGALGHAGRRNVLSLANVAWSRTLTWADPRVTTLERQATIPITGVEPIEMGLGGAEHVIAERLGADACYRQMFAAAFPEEGGTIALATVAKALAAFQRTMVSVESPWDRYRRGDTTAMTAEARRGAELFAGTAECAGCHAGPFLSDGSFHRLEPDSARRPDRGLAEITGNALDAGRFRTPPLRHVALTGPYFHDGSAPTLVDAIGRHRAVAPAVDRLTSAEMGELVAFLTALTDSAFVTDPRYQMPRRFCGRAR